MASKQSICLNMIVKNEAHVIERCLESVKQWIDSWIIADTGSTDGTQEKILSSLKEIPGKLYERPWVDFATNRNEVLDFSLGQSDYLLLIDADDYLETKPDFEMPFLDADVYIASHQNEEGLCHSPCILLISNSDHWRWKGVLHEELISSQDTVTGKQLEQIKNHYTLQGHRNHNLRNKYLADIEVLKKALESDPDNARYLFYLAQTYRGINRLDLAIEAYEKRIALHSKDAQETFCSLYCLALSQKYLRLDPSVYIENFRRAHDFCPTRIEPLYHLAEYELTRKNYDTSYCFVQQAQAIPLELKTILIEVWMRDWGFSLLLGEIFYGLKKWTESHRAYQKALKARNLPPSMRRKIEFRLDRDPRLQECARWSF